jgi:hypothetical protein
MQHAPEQTEDGEENRDIDPPEGRSLFARGGNWRSSLQFGLESGPLPLRGVLSKFCVPGTGLSAGMYHFFFLNRFRHIRVSA